MLNEFLYTKIEEEDIDNIWCQQDSATCHTADVLRPIFKDHIISRRAGVVCPPGSCDLTPLDYYLWGAIKDKCCADKPETIDALIEKPTHPKRVTVLCGFWSRDRIVPFYFENDEGEAVTVNGNCYRAMLNKF